MFTPVVSNITLTSTTGATCRCTHAPEKSARFVRLSGLLILALALSGNALASQSVSLAWNPITNGAAAGYAVYFGATNGLYPSRFDVGTNTYITVSGLKEGTTNYFAVAAYDSARVEGPQSAAIPYLVPGLVRVAPPATQGAPFTLSFPVASGHYYILQSSTNFQTWTNLWQTTLSSSNVWVSYQDAQPKSVPRRFYRLIMD